MLVAFRLAGLSALEAHYAGAKAAYPTTAKNAPVSGIESIGPTRSQARPAIGGSA
jgi:hypothetical protein